MSAFSRRHGLAGVLLVLAVVPRGFAQDDTTGVLDTETIEDIDQQLDSETTESRPNTELWEEYQRYKRDGGQDRDRDYKTSGERVNFGDDVTVFEGERVEGDVVAIGGDAIIYGAVVGDVVSIGGDVVLHEGAYVDGEVVSVGGSVDERGEVEVTGDTVSIDLGFNILPLGRHRPDLDLPSPRFVSFAGYFTFLFVSLLIGLLFYAIAPTRLDAISRRIEAEPGQSFLIGLLSFVGSPFLLVLAIVLLAITVIGLLLLPVVAIVLVVMVIGGFFAVALAVGRRAAHFRESGELRAARSPYFYLFIGYLTLSALQILGSLFRLGGGFLGPLGTMFGVVGGFVLLFATILGFGALVTSRFGRHPVPVAAGWQGPPPPPPPPPVPGAVPPPGAAPPPPPPGEGPAPVAGPPREAPGDPPEPGDEERPA